MPRQKYSPFLLVTASSMGGVAEQTRSIWTFCGGADPSGIVTLPCHCAIAGTQVRTDSTAMRGPKRMALVAQYIVFSVPASVASPSLRARTPSHECGSKKGKSTQRKSHAKHSLLFGWSS